MNDRRGDGTGGFKVKITTNTMFTNMMMMLMMTTSVLLTQPAELIIILALISILMKFLGTMYLKMQIRSAHNNHNICMRYRYFTDFTMPIFSTSAVVS